MHAKSTATPSDPMNPSILLRQWRDPDVEPLTAMHTEVEVMRFLPRPHVLCRKTALQMEAGKLSAEGE